MIESVRDHSDPLADLAALAPADLTALAEALGS